MSTSLDGSSSSSDGNPTPDTSVPPSLCDEPIDAAKDASSAATAGDNADVKDVTQDPVPTAQSKCVTCGRPVPADPEQVVPGDKAAESEAKPSGSGAASEACEVSDGASDKTSSNAAESANPGLASEAGETGAAGVSEEAPGNQADKGNAEEKTIEIEGRETDNNGDGPEDKSDQDTDGEKTDEVQGENDRGNDEDNTSADSNTDENDGQKPSSEPLKLELPAWFLETNFLLFDQMDRASPGIRFFTPDDDKEERPPSKEDESGNFSGYELHRDVYEDILDTVSAAMQPPPASATSKVSDAWAEAAAFMMQSPRDGSLEFLEHVARRIAVDLKADLISLDFQSLEDLCLHFWDFDIDSKKYEVESLLAFEEVFSGSCRLEDRRMGCEAILRGVEQKLAGAKVENKEAMVEDNEATVAKRAERPLVLLVQTALPSPTDAETFSQWLHETISAKRGEKQRIIIIATAESSHKQADMKTHVTQVWQGLMIEKETVFNITPRHTKQTSESLNRSKDRLCKRSQWLRLRRAIVCALRQSGQDTIADSLFTQMPGQAQQDGLPEKMGDDARQLLAKWNGPSVSKVVRHILARACREGAPPLEAKDVYDIMARVWRTGRIFKASRNPEKPFEDEKKKEGKSRIEKLVDEIRDDCTHYEKLLLPCVADIDSTAAAADGIRIDPDIMAGLDQMLSLRVRKSHGLLAKQAINGGVLFGPPGTGKTHLARVVAAKSNMNLIVATPADIQSCWVGETEELIKGLFGLARRISPCIIFIDEAESLLARRRRGDQNWTRKAMSQFLSEMDGLVQDDRKGQAPFLLIATNRPADLDDAVCRRLPHMLHIPMPRLADRRAILEIYLREEKVAADVELDRLAAATDGFSGSDLRTLCIQAAMAAQREIDSAAKEKQNEEKEEEPPLRVINSSHFRKALARTRPSVTKDSLMTINRFIEGCENTC